MLICKLYTGNYKHDDFFKFKGKSYRVNSIVRLNDKGKRYLGSRGYEVVLAEQFTNWDGKLCWKYRFKSISLTVGVIDYSTDVPPYKLIEEVVCEASAEYVSRQTLGKSSPHYKTGIKCSKKDWEIREVVVAWVVLMLVFIGAAIFKDWYVQLIIRAAALNYFIQYRRHYIDINTTYIHEEDTEILKWKHKALFGIEFEKENDKNE